jgi:hypothetical protein
MIISSNNIFYDINGGIITVEGALSINESTFENFAVWPNPSNGYINLSLNPSSNGNIQVSLYDIKGSRVYTEEFKSNGNIFEQSIDFSTLNAGMYFIKVTSDGINKTNKLIIN